MAIAPCNMNAIAVIAAYNEERHIGAVVKNTVPFVQEVIVVDDHSSDDTGILARQAGALVLRHDLNLGKAGAIKTGCEAAIAHSAQFIILLDGDGQHNPDLIPLFLEKLNDQTDIVFGSRKDTHHMPLIRKIGTKCLELLMKFLFQVNICDMQCGFRAFKTKVYPVIRWNSKNYHADAEITARVGKYHLRYAEVLIETIYHDTYKGMTIIDGLTLLGKVLIWRAWL